MYVVSKPDKNSHCLFSARTPESARSSRRASAGPGGGPGPLDEYPMSVTPSHTTLGASGPAPHSARCIHDYWALCRYAASLWDGAGAILISGGGAAAEPAATDARAPPPHRPPHRFSLITTRKGGIRGFYRSSR